MNPKYTLLVPFCMIITALTITTGCNQPAAAPAKTEGLASVPPQPAATPQPAAAEPPVPAEPAAMAIPAPKAPKPATESAAATPKEPAAAVAVPLTDNVAPTAIDTTNLIPEGGWEEGYPGWQLVGKAAIVADDKEKLFGVRSMRFDLAGSNGFELVRWEVAKGQIKEGNRYVLKCFLKTEDVAPEADVRLTAFPIDTKTKRMSWFKSQPYHGTQGWTEVEVRFGIPRGHDALAVRIEYAHGPKKAAKGGKIWVDDVALFQVTGEIDEPINILKNGDFDSGVSYWSDLPDAKHLAADTAEKQIQGKSSLRIDLKDLSKANLMQWIGGATPNATYRLDGYMKLADVQGNAFLTVVAENSQRKNKAWLGTEKLTGTTAWKKVSLQFKTAEDTDTLGVRFEYQPEKPGTPASGGTIWLDNISLTELE
ncbi:MAG: carbohydrate binding domain-containing protein [Candidatus Hydrogenedentes bacterium]|nr:carbohydrate binding domain-containing protein [Candidatus Hydrogenedentota bacterium]